MRYFDEIRRNWRPVLAATFGLGTGVALTQYTTSILAPHFLSEFGWSKSEFALVGSLSIFTAMALPLVGRLADVLGVHQTILIGMVAMPLIYLAFTVMTGPITQYIAIYLVQGFIGITTASMVYSRLAVQYIEKTRGLALAIVACGPALVGVIGAPMLNSFVDSHGWRTGCYALAVFSIIAAVITLLLLPPRKEAVAMAGQVTRRSAREDYPAIVRNPAFWVLLVAMLLCNLPQIIALSQLKLVLEDQGITAGGISAMLSVFAIGTLAGRVLAGLALDRFPSHIVGMLAMSLPGIGLLLLASSLDMPAVVGFAVLCFGFSLGAEGDIVAYIVARHFGVEVYSSVMGLMTMAISLSGAFGAAILSLSLKLTGGFDAFLLGTAITAIAGSLLFLLLPRQPRQEAAPI